MTRTKGILAISSALLALCALAGCNHDEQHPQSAVAAVPAAPKVAAAPEPTTPPPPRLDCSPGSQKPGCVALDELRQAQTQLRGYTAVLSTYWFDRDYLRKPLRHLDTKETTGARRGMEEHIATALKADPADATPLNAAAAAMRDCATSSAEAYNVAADHDTFSAQADACNAHVERALDDLRVALGLVGFTPKPDFMGMRWGDPQEQVQAAITGRSLYHDGNMYAYEAELSGHPAHMMVWFIDGKLARARYLFLDKHSDNGAFLNDYDEIDKLLTEKYGKPSYSGMNWSNDLFKDDPSKYGLALAAGHMQESSNWRGPTTRITHLAGGDNFSVYHGIEYQSVEYAWAMEQAEKQKAKSAL